MARTDIQEPKGLVQWRCCANEMCLQPYKPTQTTQKYCSERCAIAQAARRARRRKEGDRIEIKALKRRNREYHRQRKARRKQS